MSQAPLFWKLLKPATYVQVKRSSQTMLMPFLDKNSKGRDDCGPRLALSISEEHCLSCAMLAAGDLQHSDTHKSQVSVSRAAF